ncbi:hypothetical protein SK069_05640 [Patulibacter brassicae]|uniref:Uncharacterized protein n=1 Tax=Patulibacter brassicae TaxID=1705717 RepID=A0ABU4VJG1_9ACTN|nr:hypothetical protein [Patulibacter brassicae]MDX8151066.1 hypothetical protein [Patulibacter brassicae]
MRRDGSTDVWASVPGRATRALALVLCVGATAGLTACGGGDESSGGSGTTAEGNRDRAKIQACLKEKGVELPERPAGAGGGSGGPADGGGGPGGYGPPDGAGGPSGGPPDGPPGGGLPGDGAGRTRTSPTPPGGGMSSADREKFQKALQECGGASMNGRGGMGGRRPNMDSAEDRKRVRAYVTCVRKNGYDLPDPDFSGNGPIFDPDDVDRDDATFRKASAACQSELRPSREQGADDDARERAGGSSS